MSEDPPDYPSECIECFIKKVSCQLDRTKRKQCPCLSCLIKVLCKDKCEERVNLWNQVNVPTLIIDNQKIGIE